MDQIPTHRPQQAHSIPRSLTLRTKLLLLILCVACSLVATLMGLGLHAIKKTSKTAQEVSARALESQAQYHMIKVTHENAARNALILDKTMAESNLLASVASEYFSEPQRHSTIGKMQGALNLRRKPNGNFIEGLSENASLHLPSFVSLDSQIMEQLYVGRAIDPLALGILENDHNAAAVYLITNREISRYYPNIDLDLPKDFIATEEFFYSDATPDANPERLNKWTDVYEDPAGQGLMVSAISPIYTNSDQFIGVIGVDFRLSDLGDAIESAALAEGSYSFLIDENARTIAFPEQAFLDILQRPRLEGESGIDLSETTGELGALIEKMTRGERGVSRVNIAGEEKFMAYVPLGESGWSLATVISTRTILSDVQSLRKTLTKDIAELTLTKLIPLAIIVLVIVTSLAFYLAYRFTLPLRQLTHAAAAIGRREWDVKLPQQRNDEVGILSSTLGDMAAQLKDLIGSLETRVTERTSELSDALANLEQTNDQLSEQINERRISDAARMDLENRFKHAFQNAPIGMALMDLSGRVLNPNPKLQELFWPDFKQNSKIVELPLLESVVVDNEQTKFQEFRDSLHSETISAEFTCIAHGGALCKIVFFLSIVEGVTEKENYIVLLAQDVTAAQEMTQLLQQQANHDELTGLPNRRAFSTALQEHAQGSNKLAENHLLFLDLDRFKIVNDSCGHAEGDRLLVEASKLILKGVGSNDIVARLGGDEFAILLLNCNQEIAHRKADQIRTAIHQYEFRSNGEIFRIGVSIGLVSIDGDGKNFSDLQSLADAACYAAKEAGRNRVHVVAGADDKVAEHRGKMRWVQRLRDAIDNDRFILHGQQFQHLKPNNNGSEHVEILLRMQNQKNNELIFPGTFLPVAERYGLLVEIDKWVVNNLLFMLNGLCPLSLHKQTYWVNLSGASLGDADFREFLIEKMTQSSLPAGVVNFEVTETVVIKSMGNAKELIAALQNLGCEIALDDFGSGLSSLTYLKTLNVDYLKIDGSFVKGVVNDDTDRLFVKSTIEIANHLGIKTIAEFVENNQIRNVVASLGADYAQGFGIHRPQDLHSLLQADFRKAG